VRTCVIFNPAARGEKNKRFLAHLGKIEEVCTLLKTDAAGAARTLAARAVREGFETIVAAGGDGTLNEVLNGIGDVPDGFARARLGILPLGTVNVFAREISVAGTIENAWEVVLRGKEIRIDLPYVEYQDAKPRRYFAQLAGAGLDARAIELVKWEVKKKLGPLAYVLAGFHAVIQRGSQIQVTADGKVYNGGLVLIGNGRLYGGEFKLFPAADLRDGVLDVCVFPAANLLTLARCAPSLLLRQRLPTGIAHVFSTRELTLDADSTTPLQIDGELIGHLPAALKIVPLGLRVIVP
jgi:diacylglycerol kinase (ATP)